MKIEGPNTYRLRLKNGEILSIDGQKNGKFKQPDNDDGVWKIYIVKYKVKSNSEVAYIGRTKQNIRTRLRQGLQPKGKRSYGYKWRKLLPEVEILIWCFPAEGGKGECVEAVEAELVYLIRKSTGKWPSYQMEIHFYGSISETINKNVTKAAKEIFNFIK